MYASLRVGLVILSTSGIANCATTDLPSIVERSACFLIVLIK